MKPIAITICILQCGIALGFTNLVPVVGMAGVPEPVQEYARSLYPNKQGTALQGVVDVTSDLTRSFFPKKRFFAIHAVNRRLQALISQGHSRSTVTLENDMVSPAGAVAILKELSVTNQPSAERVVQLYSHLYGGSLVTRDVVKFAKQYADDRHDKVAVSNLDAKRIVKLEPAKENIKVTAHFGSRVAIRRVVFLMSKNGVAIKESKEVFRSVYYR